MENIIIRGVTPDDAESLVGIYRFYVEHTAITFEYDVPSVEEFRRRIENTLRKYPYLAAEHCGKIVGYAYAGAFVGRAAYDWCAELSIYLDHSFRYSFNSCFNSMTILHINPDSTMHTVP